MAETSYRLVEVNGHRYLVDADEWKDVSGPAMVHRECLEVLHPLSCAMFGCRYE